MFLHSVSVLHVTIEQSNLFAQIYSYEQIDSYSKDVDVSMLISVRQVKISQLANYQHGDFVMDFVLYKLNVQSQSEVSAHDLPLHAGFHFVVLVANFRCQTATHTKIGGKKHKLSQSSVSRNPVL